MYHSLANNDNASIICSQAWTTPSLGHKPTHRLPLPTLDHTAVSWKYFKENYCVCLNIEATETQNCLTEIFLMLFIHIIDVKHLNTKNNFTWVAITYISYYKWFYVYPHQQYKLCITIHNFKIQVLITTSTYIPLLLKECELF